MQQADATGNQVSNPTAARRRGEITLRRAMLVPEHALEAELERVPWVTLLHLRCDRRPDGTRALSYEWRAG